MIIRCICFLLCCVCPSFVLAQGLEAFSPESEFIPEHQPSDYFSDSHSAETTFTESTVVDSPVDKVTSDEILVTTPIQNSHPGLLGKRYFRASYTHRSYNHWLYAEEFSIHGIQAEFNWPSLSFRGENFETDFFAEFIHEGVSMPDWDRDSSVLHIGFRTYKYLANPIFRPYFGLGVGIVGSTEVYKDRRYKDFGSLFSIRAGLEADLAARLTSRHEMRLWLNETGYSGLRYNGSLNFWVTRNTFLRAGIEPRFSRRNSPQLEIGLGVSF